MDDFYYANSYKKNSGLYLESFTNEKCCITAVWNMLKL